MHAIIEWLDKYVIASVILFLAQITMAEAEQFEGYRGEVGSFTNDFFGDGHDRWISGSYQRSYYSEGYRLNQVEGIEIRARGEMVPPWISSRQPGNDVPYSTLFGLGGFAHTTIVGFETRVGGEVLVLGDASGMEYIQHTFHDSFGMHTSFDPSRDDIDRVPNGITFRFDLETAKTISFGTERMLRPYMGLVAGADQAITIGTDLIVGNLASADIWTRDVVTGRLLTPQVNQIQGLSLVAGWDIRSVSSSVHLPQDAAVEPEAVQYRSRAGVQVSTGFANFFLGQAWLSLTFEGQAEPQRLGMLSVSFVF